MKKNKILPIVLALCLIVGAGALVVMLEPAPVQPITKAPLRQPVSITQVMPQVYRPTITLLGTTHARWPVEIKAQSSAKLLQLTTQTEPGTLVKQGDILAKLDTTHLKSQLAQARGAMKQAELKLQREQHEQTVALKMLSLKISSAYARREPQIASAKADLLQAKEAYISAQQYLEDATITAPFDAVILSRDISPGQQIEAGEIMFEIAASASLDVYLPVPEQQWTAITAVLEKPQIQVTDRQEQSWAASVRYVAPQADRSSRQRQVVLAVNQPYQKFPRLLPNQQVTVKVTLTEHNLVMQIPLSALTRDGQVWTIDEGDKLRIESITLIEESRHHAYVIFKNNPQQERQVVTYPLLSMVTGMQVASEMTVSALAGKENIQ
jgi:membrane fusion protein, multidrug efflux system